MTKEQLQKRKEKAESQPMMIVKTDDGYRVHSARNPSQFYHVNLQHEYPVCDCPDFEKHKNDPLAQCKHIFAVLDYEEKSRQGDAKVGGGADLERAAIQAEGNRELSDLPPGADAFPGPEVKPESKSSHMLIKRSISPDGRIDAVSIEIDFPIGDESADEIKAKAAEALKLQTEIAREFTNSGPAEKPKATDTPKPQPTALPQQQSAKPVLAKMLSIGLMNGKFGPRYFINFEVNGSMAKRFGTQKQIIAWISEAGYTLSPNGVVDGMELNIPCRVITKPSTDGRYINIERIFPASQS